MKQFLFFTCGVENKRRMKIAKPIENIVNCVYNIYGINNYRYTLGKWKTGNKKTIAVGLMGWLTYCNIISYRNKEKEIRIFILTYCFFPIIFWHTGKKDA